MLLVSEGSPSYPQWRGDVLDSPQVQSDAELFASRSPQDIIENHSEVLCVLQGEVAAASPGDGPAGLGSDSATTCHIVAFRDPATGRTCLAHLDDPDRVEEAIACMQRLMSVGGSQGEILDLYVVGGYLGKACSEELSNSLLRVLHNCPQPFRVMLACMSRLNSVRPPSAAAAASTGENVPPSQATASSSTFIIGSCSGTGPASRGSNGCGGDGEVQGEHVDDEGGSRGAPVNAEGERVAVPAGDPQARHNQPVPPSTRSAQAEIHQRGGWLPRQTGLAIDLDSGQAYPVRFEGAGRGPGWEVRSSRISAGSREEALTETSTSPEAEDERFVEDTRATLSYMLAQAGADGRAWYNNVFGANGGRPLVFPRVAPGVPT